MTARKVKLRIFDGQHTRIVIRISRNKIVKFEGRWWHIVRGRQGTYEIAQLVGGNGR